MLALMHSSAIRMKAIEKQGILSKPKCCQRAVLQHMQISHHSHLTSTRPKFCCSSHNEDKAARDEENCAASSSSSTWQQAIIQASNSFTAMSAGQRAWLIAATLLALLAIPRALILVLIAAERLVVGSLLATEAVIASLLTRALLLGGGVAVAVLMIWGVYAFVFDKKNSS
ncbi:hypothetical protein CEUSTIGMA_g9530.t1 [Chlamydomonas eustigma]|uniref:Uncharacterized protein n=1 Tax=Chlamydomonas eustigma TaxID=1157962 RepID=A0A250XGQ1_9CHLO|nr:hypothetical protein CEUSTIGMA_g9530.t1 [Chlamydomonas eustigma]|eukprot:GAX82102.1 hypothetical protein CEUSTIGMA_g9530.t1 [Chlamydomonas eustigma]